MRAGAETDQRQLCGSGRASTKQIPMSDSAAPLIAKVERFPAPSLLARAYRVQ
jgi:hypothetical protein